MRIEHFSACWIVREMKRLDMLTRIAVAIVMVFSFGSLSRAAADESDEREAALLKAFFELDQYRHGNAEKMEQMEAQAVELQKQFNRPAEKARINACVAHVYAQSDILQHHERVTHFGKLALTKDLPIVDRLKMFSYLSSAEFVNSAGRTLSARRIAAAKWSLKGYHELLRENLPDVKPDLPGVGRYDIGDENSIEAHNARIELTLQMANRKEAERVRELIFHRGVMHDQIHDLYKDKPEAFAELRQLVKQEIGENEEIVKHLLQPRVRFPE
jgi:hypothetical protein